VIESTISRLPIAHEDNYRILGISLPKSEYFQVIDDRYWSPEDNMLKKYTLRQSQGIWD